MHKNDKNDWYIAKQKWQERHNIAYTMLLCFHSTNHILGISVIQQNACYYCFAAYCEFSALPFSILINMTGSNPALIVNKYFQTILMLLLSWIYNHLFGSTYMRQWSESSLNRLMAYPSTFDAMPLSDVMLFLKKKL